MGIFHDKCEAIVYAATGKALSAEDFKDAQKVLFPVGAVEPLSGRAKEEALAARGWRVCGCDVSKKARVCSTCGSLAPRGYVKCPSCREWVGNESKYCPHCNHPLRPEERIDFAGGVWDRAAGVFAQRFELDDVSQIVKGGLKIQEGTLAILLDAGKNVGILGPGRHKPEGALRNINWFGTPPPRSVVMVDAGDCVFRAEFDGLRTKEELPVKVVAEITLRFDTSHADSFLANVLKDSRSLAGEEICNILKEEAYAAVKKLCVESTVEDLVKDPECRPRLQKAIGESLKDLFERSSLELVRVGFVEFISSTYEKFRQANAGLEEKRRQVEFERKVRGFKFGEMKDDWEDDKAERDFGNERERDSAEENLAMREFRLGVKKRSNIIRSDSELEDAEAEKTHFDLEARKVREKELRKRDLADYLLQLGQEKQLGDISRKTELIVASLMAEDEVKRKEAEIELRRISEGYEKEYQELHHQLKKVDFTNDIERAKAANKRAEEIAAAEHTNVITRIKGQGDLDIAVAEANVEKVTDGRTIDHAVAESKIGEIKREDTVKDAEAQSKISRMQVDDKAYENAKIREDLAGKQAMSQDLLKFMQGLEMTELQTRAGVMKGMSYAEMAAVATDPAERAQYLEMARQAEEAEYKRKELEARLEASRITASVQVAQVQGQAEAAKAQAQAQASLAAAQAQVAANDKTLEELKSVMKDRADHDERSMKMMQELAGKALEKPDTIVNQQAPAQVIVPTTPPQPINIVK